jgi:acetyl esterase/lipase
MPAPAHRSRLLAGIALLAIASTLAVAAAPAQALLGGRLLKRLAERRNAGTTTLPAPAGMQAQRDIAYGPDPKQRLDAYLPARAHDAPILVMVHGGAWAFGDKSNDNVIDNKLAHWIPQGFIVVSVNNRLLPQAAPLEQARDVASALSKVQALAPSWGGNPRALVLMGHSAGAHLAALLDADPALLEAAGALPPRGVVSLDSAAMDVPELMSRGSAPLPRLYRDAFGDDPADWAAASPYQRLHAGAPPMLVVCSSRRADSCPQGKALIAKAAGLGVRMELQPEDLNHGQINQTLGLPSDYTAVVDRFIASVLH